MVAIPAPARRAPADVVVAPMRRRHLRGVLAIEHSVYPTHWSPALFAAELAQRSTRRYLVALDASPSLLGSRELLGYAGVMVVLDEAHVTTVAVAPEHHRRKVGTRLLLGVLDAAARMGASAATLEVRTTNPGARRLYEQFGFVEAGVRPRYYAETGEDALIMWAHGLDTAAYAARLDAQRRRLGVPGGATGPDLAVPWVRGRRGLDRPEGESA